MVITAAVASLLAAAWYLWRRRKARLLSEKTGRMDLDNKGTKRMPVVAGDTLDPYVIEPFYTPVPNPGHGHLNVTPTLSPQNRQVYPDSSSGYYSDGTLPSTSSPGPSGYSPPPNQSKFAPLQFRAPSTATGTTNTASTVPESRATPWATSILGETSNESNQRPVVDPSVAKARYSGANNNVDAGSTSRSLSSPIIDDSVPPPQYEL